MGYSMTARRGAVALGMLVAGAVVGALGDYDIRLAVPAGCGFRDPEHQ
jgi:hypothetical protein